MCALVIFFYNRRGSYYFRFYKSVYTCYFWAPGTFHHINCEFFFVCYLFTEQYCQHIRQVGSRKLFNICFCYADSNVTQITVQVLLYHNCYSPFCVFFYLRLRRRRFIIIIKHYLSLFAIIDRLLFSIMVHYRYYL